MIIGTLGTLYGMESTSQSSELQAALRKDLTTAGAVALLIFSRSPCSAFLLSPWCAERPAAGKWPAIQFAYMTALAYFGALAANQIITRLSA